MDVIEIAASAVERDPMSASDVESACRFAVARSMRESRRLLADNEVEDIVGDIVDEETYVEPEALEPNEDGEIELTDSEWESVDEGEKVVYGDKVGLVVNGSFCPVVTVPDFRVARISARICKSIEAQAHIIASTGIDERSLYHTVPDVLMPCPKCESTNVTPVWFDGGEVVACCNACGEEFDASVEDVARATLAERTVEDIDIIPEHDVFGSVWCSGNGGFGYEIYASGELVDAGEDDTFEGVIDRFDAVADAYDDIEEGVGVDMASGFSGDVESISEDRIVFDDGRTASRAKIARMVADGSAFLDFSNVMRIAAYPGQELRSISGRSIEVEDISNGFIYASLYDGSPNGCITCKMARFTNREFAEFVDKGGYR